jgi:hypothetical protein
MNKLRVKCVKCSKEWEKDCSRCWELGAVTSSLCDLCFKKTITPIIRRKQLNKGHLDCFDKPGKYCDQFQCKYRKWCNRAKQAA